MLPLLLAMLVVSAAAQNHTGHCDDYSLYLCHQYTAIIMTFNGTCTCMCPLPHAGLLCEKENQLVQYPKFDGTSWIWMQHIRHNQTTFNLSLTFRPENFECVLIYGSQHSRYNRLPVEHENARDFFSAVLIDGYVVFRFDCGSGLAELNSTSRVNLNSWNKLVISRVGRRGTLQLNNEQPVEGLSRGNEEVMTFNTDSSLRLGGMSGMLQEEEDLVGTQQRFVGCFKELLIEGRKTDFRFQANELLGGFNIDHCDHCLCENGGTCPDIPANESVCLCPLGFYGDDCTKSQTVHVPQFSGQSYIVSRSVHRLVASFSDIKIVFKPNSTEGLLLYQGLSQSRHGYFVSISLRRGFLEFRFDLGSRPAVLRSVKPLTVGSWHIVQASRTGRNGTLKIDDEAPVTGQSQGDFNELTLSGKLYLGGHPNFDQTSRRAEVRQSFSGCIQQVIIDKRALNLTGDAVYGYNIRPCSDICDGRPCLNEELYKRLLYQITGTFDKGPNQDISDLVGLFNVFSVHYRLIVTPVNTTLFPNKETFFVTHGPSGTNFGLLMTLQYFKERLVQVERHYFLPGVNLTTVRLTGPAFFNTLTWSSLNTTRNDCGGYIYLINSTNLETLGTLNYCDRYMGNSEYNLNINCSNIIAVGNYTEHNLELAERHQFPAGWSVNPC